MNDGRSRGSGNTARPAAATTGERLMRAFACAALEPGTGGLLLLGLDPAHAPAVAEACARVLEAVRGTPVPRLTLGAADRDEDLWLRTRPQRSGGVLSFVRGPGPLTGDSLVLVPDLARLSLAGMRAAVQTAGADVAVVEHAVVSRTWRPRALWLVCCGHEDARRLSPHLLDRFPLRLHAGPPTGPGRRRTESGGPFGGADPMDLLPPGWHAVLTGPPAARAALTEEAVDFAVERAGGAPGMRRALCLARTARALATLDGDPVAGPERISEALRLTGLPTSGLPPFAGALPATAGPPTATGPAGTGPEGGPRGGPSGTGGEQTGRSVREAAPGELLDAFPAPARPPTAYPEDDPDPLRAHAPLRPVWRHRPGPAGTAGRGPVVGIRAATDLRDLAWVATVVEAAKYRNVPGRRAARGAGDPLTVAATDLRGYARAPEPERLLVLLLDHTCRAGWDRRRALAPYLQWAYAERAGVCVVETGHRDAVDELRAESFLARGVLDPRVAAALHRAPGRATPLAHALVQADQALLRAFRSRRAGLVEAWLVVATDGRGNVPLTASVVGRAGPPAGRQGVDDALAAARDIGARERMRLRRTVLAPRVTPYAGLPAELADALGGVLDRPPGDRDGAQPAGEGATRAG